MRLRAYLESVVLIVKINLHYKANLAFSALFPYVTAGMMFLFWDAALPPGTTALGYGRQDLITYYLLAALLQNAVMPNVQYDVFYGIRNGEFDIWSVKPVSYPLRSVIDSVGSSLFRLCFSAAVMLPLIAFIVHRFGAAELNLGPGALLSVLLAVVLAGVISTMVSMVAFWLENADGMAWLVYFGGMLTSGQIIPLDFFPSRLRAIFEMSPFSLLFAFPADLLLGREALAGPVILRQIFWIVLLGAGATTLLYSRGSRRYQSAGG